MTENEKRELMELIERGDRYGLMVAGVRQWVVAYHPAVIRTALYAIEEDDAEPTRIRIPLSVSETSPTSVR